MEVRTHNGFFFFRLQAQESQVQAKQIDDEEEERKFIEDSVALIELQERDPTAFPALPVSTII